MAPSLMPGKASNGPCFNANVATNGLVPRQSSTA